ncbi:zinc finger protein PLAG1-like isoform X2 [Varroa jacobsoni]|uniref:C2H2-type domain-containing protein n=1 Tax=Varroa destructor TaxID=109461 RepID=A0A7M7J7C9_VARDE|nr:zinc finger protein PLAG1-like isoform X2 [Varroa destructor]XP_022701197.1 zinc finger protein PLAG1-like isoform X2 [Varroa jacobsoni]
MGGAMDLLLKNFSSMQKLNMDFLSQANLLRSLAPPPPEQRDFERVPSPGPSSPQNLSLNSPVSSRVNVYHCPECTYTSNNRANVQRHVNTRHQIPEKLWPCRYCTYRTHRKDHLKSHEKRHEKNMDLTGEPGVTQVIEFD